MKNVEFEPQALQQFTDWANEDRKIFNRIVKLIIECTRNPFHGTGKPEPLTGNLSGAWSRRIDHQHRLVLKQQLMLLLLLLVNFIIDVIFLI